MKALVKYAAGRIGVGIKEIAEPCAAEGQLKVRVDLAGICGSDLHILNDSIGSAVRMPVVLGHEYIGTVVEVGAGVENFFPGDRVVSQTSFGSCGQCYFCKSGQKNMCNSRKTIGYWYDGAFADYLTVPANIAYHVPDSVDDGAGVMCEPLACVCRAINTARPIKPGDTVLVLGPGPIGQMIMQVCRNRGAAVVMAGTENDAERLALAERLGATRAVNTEHNDLLRITKEMTGGSGYDMVFECSGSERAIQSALLLVRKQGHLILVGFPSHPIHFDTESICYKEITVTGALGSGNADWIVALELLRNKQVDLKPLGTSRYLFRDWEKALNAAESRQGCKVLLFPPRVQTMEMRRIL